MIQKNLLRCCYLCIQLFSLYKTVSTLSQVEWI